MKDFVKIIIKDKEDRVLEHFYLRENLWDLPAGKIEKEETPKQAAVRELLERTGFRIKENDLEEDGPEGDFLVFTGQAGDLVKEAEPGEKGGYSTKIRWR